jgi:hypothetical protein
MGLLSNVDTNQNVGSTSQIENKPEEFPNPRKVQAPKIPRRINQTEECILKNISYLVERIHWKLKLEGKLVE